MTHVLLFSQPADSGISRPPNPTAKIKRAVPTAVITFDYLQNHVSCGGEREREDYKNEEGKEG